jgi:DMSO/TMAO reductase YedYZ molybdopterin-dependent catalytic subunit
MSKIITRRSLIKAALGTAAVASAGGFAALLAKRYGLVPPDNVGLYGVGETLTYATQRVLLPRGSLAREFNRTQISENFPAFGTTMPRSQAYLMSMVEGFERWLLVVGGLVARPARFSLAELKQFPSRTQVTEHICEEGWSAIGEWTGVQLSHVLDAIGVKPEAKYVVFECVDGHWGSLDMEDARHPQTLLAYGMNGSDLQAPHGAPVRLRVERQLGYKSLKYIGRITVTDTVKNIGKGMGGSDPDAGYSWYAGI